MLGAARQPVRTTIKLYAAIALSALLASQPGWAATPTAQELKAAYVAFRGGQQALIDLRAVEREGSVHYFGPAGERDGRYRTCVRYGQAVAIRLDVPDLQLAERWSAATGAQECTGEFESCRAAPARTDELQWTARAANREILFEALDWSTGRVSFDANVARVHVGSEYYRLDVNTGQLLEQGNAERKRVYGDWHSVGPVRFPYLIADYYHGEPRLVIQLASVATGDELGARCRCYVGTQQPCPAR